MTAAWAPDASSGRLMLLDPSSRSFEHTGISGLSEAICPGDLLVFNDAATLPASLRVRARGRELELRLAGWLGPARWRAVLFGEGDWRQDTDTRPAPPLLEVGDPLELEGLALRVEAVDVRSPRLLEVRAPEGDDAALWRAIYRLGRPVQYSYLRAPLALEAVQTLYAGRPWAVEMPSAGRPFTPELLTALRRRGVRLASLTHAAGLSATGDPALDALLPLAERSDIPAATVRAVLETQLGGGRVIAVGTSVVRALEGRVVERGALLPGEGVSELVLDGGHRLAVVDGLLSGMHEVGESHFRLLSAFAPPSLIRQANARAAARGYLAHEFGDSTLLLPGVLARRRCAA